MMQQTPGVYWNAFQKAGTIHGHPGSDQRPRESLRPSTPRKFPTDDIAVRKAIQYAIDKKGVIQLAEAGAFPPATRLAEGHDRIRCIARRTPIPTIQPRPRPPEGRRLDQTGRVLGEGAASD